MTHYNVLNVKLSNSQLNKSAIKNGAEVTLNLSSSLSEILITNIICHTNYY